MLKRFLSLNPTNLIAALTALLVALIATAALVISFSNLFTLAYANRFNLLSANLWAALVDGFVIVATLAVLRASLQRESTRYSWFLVVLTTLVSIIFNVWHAESFLEGFMRATSPIVLFLSFHLLMQQVSELVKTRTITLSLADLGGQVADKERELSDIETKIQTREAKLTDIEATIKNKRAELRDTQKQIEIAQATLAEFMDEVDYVGEPRPDRITERRDIARMLKNAGIAIPDIAAYFKVHPKTIERDLQLPASNGVH